MGLRYGLAMTPAARAQTVYVVGNATQFGTIDLGTNTYTQVAAGTPNQRARSSREAGPCVAR